MNNSEIFDKVAQLQAFLGFPAWLNFIGLGEADGKLCIYLYTNRKKKIPRCDIPDIWYDIPVKVKYIGKIKPA